MGGLVPERRAEVDSVGFANNTIRFESGIEKTNQTTDNCLS
ncbi:hypothetical protein LEP1GSC016_0406 [Leptospira borgpetersenii serovar Hardjo-bovis str. Sponselee]|uniref:Uncharacterized protein n=2 Tax=Leptospira borgpetersenii TaxID=174 RepID=M6BWG3_LEPBO|nr:hypothetical protein LEP1GSC016_0406 [Leptospira borgpetersenii serovar Hardjo-bovis str. Sponselee]EMO61554.1 hypothetical protein LEP1GSC133_3307 [Leptospira borgpetersenii serovar Pomona str. 200901868]